jgi:DinB superfamily
MNKKEIQQKLEDNHKKFAEFIVSLNDHDFLLSVNDKWTAGQQLDHIYRSVAPVNKALQLPKFILKLIVGKANRPSREYEELVTKYKLKLGQGGRAPGRFVPKPIEPGQKEILKEKLLHTVSSLCIKIDRYSEKQLDYYIMPHPLLGKLTLREMLYFTIYHVEHHQLQTVKNLKQSDN